MKFSALIFAIIGIAVASQAHADPISTQPLTRIDCKTGGLQWNDNANVCGSASESARTTPKPDAAERSGPPLTRVECDKAGMAWNDKVNVCGGQSQSQAAANTTSPVPATILINIDKTKQRMTVSLDGVERYNWPVSTGMTRYSTPSGTYTALSMNEIWYSKEWDNAPMPHAIFFMKDGHAIHGSYEVKNLGKPASHGCVASRREMPQRSIRWSRRLASKILRSCLPASRQVARARWQAGKAPARVMARPLAARQSPVTTISGRATSLPNPITSPRGAAASSGACLVAVSRPVARVGTPQLA